MSGRHKVPPDSNPDQVALIMATQDKEWVRILVNDLSNIEQSNRLRDDLGLGLLCGILKASLNR